MFSPCSSLLYFIHYIFAHICGNRGSVWRDREYNSKIVKVKFMYSLNGTTNLLTCKHVNLLSNCLC